MIKPITTPGKTYAVTSPNGCTVTTDDGLTLAEIEAGKQGYFVAVSGKVLLSDDAAVLTQLFKVAPQQRLALLGVLGGGVPSWKLKYAHCVTRDDMLAVNPDYKNDFTSDGEWIYPLTKMEVCSDRWGKPAWYLFEGVTQKSFVTEMPAATNVYRMFKGASFDEVRISLPNFTSQNQGVIFGDANIKKAVLVAPKWENMGWLCNGACIETLEVDAPVKNLDAISPNSGKYKLRNVRLTTTQLATADGAFMYAQLTRESALHILGILPTYTSGTHKLTIGIHVDHKYDVDVNLALKKADINYEPTVELPEEVTEGKGWNLAVQWNGTPTSTASTMAMGQLVYAKVSTHELPDGTNEQYLDWGHYVTDWEARGYEQFRSLASAYRYFGMPEEPLTNN